MVLHPRAIEHKRVGLGRGLRETDCPLPSRWEQHRKASCSPPSYTPHSWGNTAQSWGGDGLDSGSHICTPRITNREDLTHLPETTRRPRGGKGQRVPVPEPSPRPPFPGLYGVRLHPPVDVGGQRKGTGELQSCSLAPHVWGAGAGGAGRVLGRGTRSLVVLQEPPRHNPSLTGGAGAGGRGCAVAVAAGLLAPRAAGPRPLQHRRDVSET